MTTRSGSIPLVFIVVEVRELVPHKAGVHAIRLRGHRQPADQSAKYEAHVRAASRTHLDEHGDQTNERHVEHYAQDQSGDENRWMLLAAMYDSDYKARVGNPDRVVN